MLIALGHNNFFKSNENQDLKLKITIDDKDYEGFDVQFDNKTLLIDGKNYKDVTPLTGAAVQLSQDGITYEKFPNIVANSIFHLPIPQCTVKGLYRFMSNLNPEFEINKADMDYYFSKLTGTERDKFIELFGVVEKSNAEGILKPNCP
ncbi:hypothetical protein Lbir_1321 [Legionella birminghamensis]|uniref:Uncharacterized protein n=1 Tax=Legionella birminghamensis TaxID=28083 RepID=A0A378IBJ8_9GAMM|nr:hypothetical protein [Legionella birminghamensis]KTC72546.1 hypothetical protein Lbir_1321 [Legionella birminghamensis]STX32145.1 Uncharacterised protein [Legionella birminghamensis]